MDDKETKNIDGVIPPEDSAQKAPEKITVNIDESAPADEASTDVNISSEGDIAVEKVAEETVSAEDTAPEAPVEVKEPEAPVQPEVEELAKDEVAHDDPGIVPSVQPAQATAASPATEVARLKERTKHLKIWLVILMLLLVAVASALVVYFAGQSKAKSDLKAQQQANAELQSQLTEQQQTTTQKTIDDLNAQLAAEKEKNAQLQKTIDTQNTQIKAYQTAITELQKKCGTACSTVDVPDDTTTTNTTN